ncbi:hypothetical protein SUGI_1140910 [Cryptomeria japonica]|nr:hypothetical protein SUGI_1140910 [Cryptomeria japonica]
MHRTKHYGRPHFPLSEDYPTEPRCREFLTWSVHRSGITLGQSTRSLSLRFNALYFPFLFLGMLTIDFYDAMLIAEQHLWVATKASAHNNGNAQSNCSNCWRMMGIYWLSPRAWWTPCLTKGPVWDHIVKSR